MSETAGVDLLISIQEVEGLGQITLKGEIGSDDVHVAVDEAIGLQVPEALGVSHGDGARAVWMAPDELLLIASRGEVAPGLEKIANQLDGQHHMALDVSDARTVFRLTGARVGEVLAKGAPCDCSDHGFPPGTARRTHMGGLAVGIWRVDAETWEIMCFRSYAHHLKGWLEQTSIAGSEVYPA